MRYWKLPPWADPRRALKVLNSAAAEGGVVQSLKERAKELQGRQLEEVELPGFHLFDYGGTTPPYSWLVPKPRGSYEDIINYWEMYVGEVSDNRKANLDPLRSIRDIRSVLSTTSFNRYFGKPRKAACWAAPAAKIIALAQHLPGQGQECLSVEFTRTQPIERRRLVHVRMHIADLFMEVTPTSLYTNFRGVAPKISFPAGDGTLDELCIRPIRTRHPLAVAVSECEDAPVAVQQAAAVVFRALALKQLRESDIRFSGAYGRRASRSAAVQEAQQVLESGAGSLKDLYDILVPSAIPAKDFREAFGNPFRHIRKVRTTTLDRWRHALYDLAP